LPERDYEIRVKGCLRGRSAEAFEDFTAAVRPAETVMRGRIRDQAELRGVLDRLQSLGLELLEVRRLGEPERRSTRSRRT
jgi:hypothetical protein